MAWRLRPRLTYAAYRAAAAAVRALPPGTAYRLGEAAAGLAWRIDGKRRQVVERNLARILGDGLMSGERDRLSRAVFASYGRYWVESFTIPTLTRKDLDAAVTVEGLDGLDAALAAGKGAILAIPHLGGWDFGGAWLASTGRPTTVVVEALEPPELLAWFTKMRAKSGLVVLAATKGVAPMLASALRKGEIVGLVSDRDLSGTGVPVEFFGEVTTLPAGAAMLSLRTDAPIFPAAIYDVADGRHRVVIQPPLSQPGPGRLGQRVQELTVALAAELESLIRRAPEQWHVFQPNWPSDATPDRL